MKKTNEKGSIFTKVNDTSLLLIITIVIFFVMYIGAIIFQGGGFTKPQMLFNILNANSALIITSVGLSIVMITKGSVHTWRISSWLDDPWYEGKLVIHIEK